MKRAWVLATIFNREENLLGFLSRVEAQDYVEVKLVLVDHGTRPVEAKNLPTYVNYIRSSPEKWWTGAMNDGLRYILENAKADNSDYIVFLNDDVLFEKHLVSRLVHTSECHHDAVVGAITVDRNSGRIMDANNLMSFWKARHLCPLRGKDLSEAGSEPLPSHILKGRGVVYPVKLVRELGLLDERLARRSDPEYAFRAHRRGVNVLVDPKIVVLSNVDPRTSLDYPVTLEKIRHHLFSVRSYSNLKDAFYYFRACFGWLRGMYCFLFHSAYTTAYCLYKYLASLRTYLQSGALAKQKG